MDVGRKGLKEVEKRVQMAAATAKLDAEKVRQRSSYMKSALPVCGLPVPVLRELLKTGFSFSRRPFAEQFAIWDMVWHEATTHEGRALAAFWVEGDLADAPEPATFFKTVAPWSTGIFCWDVSDLLSGLHARLLERAPEVVLPQLRIWNHSRNPWLRRQSVVSLIFQARQRAVVPAAPVVLEFVETLLGDPDHYVQKGVGWCLREASVVHPGAVEGFLRRRVERIHPTAWTAASEKLDPDFKAELAAIRKG